MAPPANGPQQSFTLPEIQEWLATTKRQGDDLRLLAAEPLYNTRREWAIMEMSKLLAEAIEEVRVISTSLQEDSTALRSRATALRHHSTALLERGRRASDHVDQCVPQSQEIPEAERRMLDMFKVNLRPAAQS